MCTVWLLAWPLLWVLVRVSGFVCCQVLVFFHFLIFGGVCVLHLKWSHTSPLETHLRLRSLILSHWGMRTCIEVLWKPQPASFPKFGVSRDADLESWAIFLFCSPWAFIAADLNKTFSVLASFLYWPLLTTLPEWIPKFCCAPPQPLHVLVYSIAPLIHSLILQDCWPPFVTVIIFMGMILQSDSSYIPGPTLKAWGQRSYCSCILW